MNSNLPGLVRMPVFGECSGENDPGWTNFLCEALTPPFPFHYLCHAGAMILFSLIVLGMYRFFAEKSKKSSPDTFWYLFAMETAVDGHLISKLSYSFADYGYSYSITAPSWTKLGVAVSVLTFASCIPM